MFKFTDVTASHVFIEFSGENQKKEKVWKYKTFLHKAPSKRLFWNGIYNLLRRADARGSADIIYRI